MAAREPVRERRERLIRGGEWLRGQRKQRGWTGVEMAARLGLNQAKLSAYETGRYEMDVSVARGIARVLGIREVDVWRGLELPLPAEFRSDTEIIEWARRNMPELMDQLPDAAERITGGKPPDALRQETRRSGHVTRKSGHGDSASRGARTAV